MEKVISIKNLFYEIPHTGNILEDINLDVHAGEFIGVLGHNGAGKTTFLDLLMGFRNTDVGHIEVLGENPNARERLHKDKILFLSHDVSLNNSISVEQYLRFMAPFYADYSLEEELRLLKFFKMDRKTSLSSLSTGQLKKVQFIAAAATKPRLLIVDEVTAVFDPQSREEFFEQLQYLREHFGAAIILATNIADDLKPFVDKVFFIKDKRASFRPVEEIAKLFKESEAA